jgi:Tol biopolymer transport system component
MSRALLAIPTLLALLVASATAESGRLPSVRNGPIVFVGEADRVPPQRTMLSIGADGRALRWLGPVGAGQPAFAPRGGKLAYVGGKGIHVAGANGSDDHLVAAWGADPVWSPDAKRLAFVDQPRNVYVVGADGSGLRLVAKAGDPEVGKPDPKLTWSPDGKRLAFAAGFVHREGKTAWPDEELRVVDLASGTVSRLTHYDHPTVALRGPFDSQPAWSPDGRFVAFVETYANGPGPTFVELVSVARSTVTIVAEARVQYPAGSSLFSPSDVVWSPDGTRLAFTDLGGTKVVRLRGRRIARVAPALPAVTPCSGEDTPSPAWSPNGRRLAVLRAPNPNSPCNLYVIPASGGRAQAVTHLRDFSLARDTPTWSSDGRRLAVATFIHGDRGSADLLVVRGTRTTALTATPDALESDPAYSRTGRLAYARENVFDVQVVVRSGSGAEKVVARGGQPTWAPDERHVAYVRDGSIYVRAVAGGRERRVAVNASDPAWSPRGGLIGFTSHGSGDALTVDVVRATGGGLRTLVAAPGESCEAPHGAAQPAWSRDGRRLAFVERRCMPGSDRVSGSIVTMRSDGTERHVVLDGSAYSSSSGVAGGFEPEWAPDGRQIAFTLSSGDRPEVAVVPAQGGAVRRLAVGSSPAWRPIARG